jgi:hypothetical protein
MTADFSDLAQIITIVAWATNIVVILFEAYIIHRMVKSGVAEITQIGNFFLFILPVFLCMMSISENAIHSYPFTSIRGPSIADEINEILSIPQVNLLFMGVWVIFITIIATQITLFKKILFKKDATVNRNRDKEKKS